MHRRSPVLTAHFEAAGPSSAPAPAVNTDGEEAEHAQAEQRSANSAAGPYMYERTQYEELVLALARQTRLQLPARVPREDSQGVPLTPRAPPGRPATSRATMRRTPGRWTLMGYSSAHRPAPQRPAPQPPAPQRPPSASVDGGTAPSHHHKPPPLLWSPSLSARPAIAESGDTSHALRQHLASCLNELNLMREKFAAVTAERDGLLEMLLDEQQVSLHLVCPSSPPSSDVPNQPRPCH